MVAIRRGRKKSSVVTHKLVTMAELRQVGLSKRERDKGLEVHQSWKLCMADTGENGMCLEYATSYCVLLDDCGFASCEAHLPQEMVNGKHIWTAAQPICGMRYTIGHAGKCEAGCGEAYAIVCERCDVWACVVCGLFYDELHRPSLLALLGWVDKVEEKRGSGKEGARVVAKRLAVSSLGVSSLGVSSLGVSSLAVSPLSWEEGQEEKRRRGQLMMITDDNKRIYGRSALPLIDYLSELDEIVPEIE